MDQELNSSVKPEPTPQPEEGPPATKSDQEKKPETKPEVKAGPPPKKTQKSAPSFWLRALRWTLGLLVVFGLGVLLSIFAFLLPARQRANEVAATLQSARQDATQSAQQIQSLQNQIGQLSAQDTNTKDLQDQLESAQLHLAILRARTDVATAQLALEKQDTSKAHIALSQTPNSLANVAGMLPQNQQKIVTDMQDRLKLADSEIDSNAYAAQSDLDVLATSLVELENTLFGGP
jgi:outer membrane biosynthesis protein TonB